MDLRSGDGPQSLRNIDPLAAGGSRIVGKSRFSGHCAVSGPMEILSVPSSLRRTSRPGQTKKKSELARNI